MINFEKKSLSLLLVFMTMFSVMPSYADRSDNSEVDAPSWPRIYFIDEGTTWELEVTPDGSDETLSVSQTISGKQIINDKEYYKLLSSVNGGESKLISYLYVDGTERTIHALDPNKIEKGERLIYAYHGEEHMTAFINWKGEMSDCDYYVYRKGSGSELQLVHPNGNATTNIYSVCIVDDNDVKTPIGEVEWVEALGNVTGLLNQLYCVDNSDKVILKKVRSVGDGVIYDATLADVEEIDVADEKKIIAIFNVNGVHLRDFEPGLNIVQYSDGSITKVLK